jgi:hypothetical protein
MGRLGIGCSTTRAGLSLAVRCCGLESSLDTEHTLSKHLPQREYDRAKTDRIIANEMLSRSMSDAKWVRLLKVLTDTIDQSISIHVKLVWDDELRTMWIRDAQHESDYYATSMEAMIGGYPRGWYDYKEIEWVDFSGTDDLLRMLKQCIDTVGLFDLESCGTTLRLFAYRRGASKATNQALDRSRGS